MCMKNLALVWQFEQLFQLSATLRGESLPKTQVTFILSNTFQHYMYNTVYYQISIAGMATDLTLNYANFAPVNVWNFAPLHVCIIMLR